MNRLPFLATAMLFCLLAAPATAETPRVVVSIKPIHSLIAAVMQGVGEPALLLPGNASPHAYAMRPSKADLLHRADIVFWVGLELESFLKGPLSSLGKHAEIVALIDQPGIKRLRTRKSGIWMSEAGQGRKHGPNAAKHKNHVHGHVHSEFDPHMWLDPENAATITRIAAEKLSAFDRKNAGQYRANASRSLAALEKLDAEIRSVLAPVVNKPYVVFHDAYQYFERRFGLNALGAISVSPEKKPGVRRLLAIRKRLQAQRIGCVFAEPQFDPALAKTLTRGTQARTAYLDPIGIDSSPGGDAYYAMLKNIGRAIVNCLSISHANKAGTKKHSLL